jgi:polyisoprenoid-binding protein YceI
MSSRKDGTYAVQVEGDLTIHGVTRKTRAAGELIFQAGKLSSRSTFKVTIKDFNITVPGVVSEKIAEEIDVTVDCQYQPKEK